MVGVDFEITQTTIVLDKDWRARFDLGKVTQLEMARAMRELSNVVLETNILLRAVKNYD